MSNMFAVIYRECGYEEAIRAARLSRNSQNKSDTIGDELGDKDYEFAMKLLNADSKQIGQPHSAGLRQIVFWMGINMPMYWWKQMDRYVIGKTQASESTMYGILSPKSVSGKTKLTQDNFSTRINPLFLVYLNMILKSGDWEKLNAHIPLSFMQERSVMISLPSLRRIISQREGHKLVEWRIFIDSVTTQAKYPGLLYPSENAKW